VTESESSACSCILDSCSSDVCVKLSNVHKFNVT
jgi:hypothetical protein